MSRIVQGCQGDVRRFVTFTSHTNLRFIQGCFWDIQPLFGVIALERLLENV